MNSTPTGGSATPSPDGDEPAVPAPRSDARRLPRRARSGAEPREPAPDTDPGHDPDGRRYSDGDAATLKRLLTGLREI